MDSHDTLQELVVENEVSYRKLLENSPVAIYTTDKEGYINFYNRAAIQLWGREPEIGKDLWCGSWKIFQPDGRTAVPLDTCPMAILLKEGRKIPNAEIIVERPDGTRKNVLPHPDPLYDKEGNMIGAVNTLVDITESKSNEERLARFEAIIKTSQDGIISKTLNGIVTSWNQAAERIFGYTAAEMIGKPIARLIPKERLNEEFYILDSVGKGLRVETFETKRVRKDRKQIDVALTISPIFDKEGKIIGASKIVRDITRQRETHEALKESEERLRMAGESSKLGTWEFHPDTKKLIWSVECKRIYGFPEEMEPDYDTVMKYTFEEDRSYVMDEVKEVMDPENRNDFKTQHRIIRYDTGEIRWVTIHGKVFFDEENNPLRLIGTMMDVTDEKRAVQQLTENEERFRMAVESTKLGTWEFFPVSGKLTWSGECRKIYGVPDDMDVNFEFFSKHIFPEDKEFAETEIARSMEAGGSGNYDIEYRIIRFSDGQIRWIRAQGKVYFNKLNQAERFIGTVLDITDAKKKEQELMDSVELFQTMADNVPAMIWMSGVDKFNDYFNKTWLQFTGRTLKEESNEGWLEGVHPQDRDLCIKAYSDALANRTGFYTEYRLRRYDGNYRWIADNSVPRLSSEGEFQGFISACIDIDDQKKMEQRKDDFIKMASHELKTPITSINGYVQLLLNIYNDQDDEKLKQSKPVVRSSLGTIAKQVSRLTRLISELLDLSRIETGKLEMNKTSFILEELIEESISEARQTTSQHAIIFNSDYKGRVTGDRDRIGQVLANLLGNAIKYSRNADKVEVSLEHENNSAVIHVKDFGIGIDKKHQSKIFERFYRAEGKNEQTYPGFGIGLFIANEIVHRHDGDISVKSQKGKGSTFTLSLPLPARTKKFDDAKKRGKNTGS